jgi:hypothetical protein
MEKQNIYNKLSKIQNELNSNLDLEVIGNIHEKERKYHI